MLDSMLSLAVGVLDAQTLSKFLFADSGALFSVVVE
jgi:hypothetical protein